MNIWKITLILTLLLSSITSQAQKEKISLGNLKLVQEKHIRFCCLCLKKSMQKKRKYKLLLQLQVGN